MRGCSRWWTTPAPRWRRWVRRLQKVPLLLPSPAGLPRALPDACQQPAILRLVPCKLPLSLALAPTHSLPLPPSPSCPPSPPCPAAGHQQPVQRRHQRRRPPHRRRLHPGVTTEAPTHNTKGSNTDPEIELRRKTSNAFFCCLPAWPRFPLPPHILLVLSTPSFHVVCTPSLPTHSSSTCTQHA